MSWIDDVDRPGPIYTYHDSPYYHSGGVSIRPAPSEYHAWYAGGIKPAEPELDDWQKALERQLQLIKDLGL